MNTNTKLSTQRRYDLDWLRILAILFVFIFHSGRFFDTGDWHIKNATTYFGVQVWTSFLALWMMPLIFVISGASLFYALGTRGAGKFIKDKVLRLLVPLVVGIFTHASLQVYLERHTQGGFQGSYFEWLPHYFEGLYGMGGNFAWMGMHLWYLLVLFLASIIFLPLFQWLKNGAGAAVLGKLNSLIAKPGVMYFLALPIMLLLVAPPPDTLFGTRNFGGWNLLSYIPFFLYGFAFMASDRLQQTIQRLRWVSLVAAIISLVVTFVVWTDGGDPLYATPRYALIFSLQSLVSWMWVLAILGFGMHHLKNNTPFLQYATEAVLPFYVMHQTVILGVGYFIMVLPIPDLAKFIINAAISFTIIMGLYEFVIRRINILRFLFGMKLLRRRAPALAPRPATSMR